MRWPETAKRRSRNCCLYSRGSSGVPPRQRHLFGESDHLVERVFAGEAPDEGLDGAAQVVLAFAGVERGQDFEHHGHHDVHPTGADEGDGAVEIEDGDAGAGRGAPGWMVSTMNH